MSETEAMTGWGSSFAISTDGGTTFGEIAEVRNITPPSDSVDVHDVTHMKSPNATREFILGLNDPGECSFDINFIPGGSADEILQEVRTARERVTCRVTWPNGVTWTFSGLMTGYEPEAAADGPMEATVTFKVTGSYVTGSYVAADGNGDD